MSSGTYRLEAPVGEFNLTRLERVISGPGKVAALKDEMEKRGLKRAVVVTTLAGFPILDEVTGALGPLCASVFTGVVQHVPRSTVDELQKEIERVDADSLVSFGGGSPIGGGGGSVPLIRRPRVRHRGDQIVSPGQRRCAPD